MTTDTSERGLERLICTALSGHPCERDLRIGTVMKVLEALGPGGRWAKP